MSTKHLEQLQPHHIDALTEVGNIGSGNAATALSIMLNTPVDIQIPGTHLLTYDEVTERLGGKENSIIGISLDITGDIHGLILHILPPSFANKLVNTFYPVTIENLSDITDMDMSVVSEMGNITSAAYVNALAGLTGMFINISTPSTRMDTIQRILHTSFDSIPSPQHQVLFIDEKLTLGDSQINSTLILMLETESMEPLFDQLGVDY